MLTKETLDLGIEQISKELTESLEDFRSSPCWSGVKGIKELSSSLYNLTHIREDMFGESEEEYSFTKEDAEMWVNHMKTNLPDGTTVRGAHWTMDQTNTVAKQKGIVWEHVTPYCFWVTMNMVYSDYVGTAIKFGVDTLDFYFSLATSFLFDVDSVPPRTKLAEYYHHIVKPAFSK